MIEFTENPDWWGAGEPSFVLMGDKLYIYYSWNAPDSTTRLAIADTGVEMMGITIYAVNAADQEALRMRELIQNITKEYSAIKAMHGFYFDKVDREISFEAETDFDCSENDVRLEELTNRILQVYPDCKVCLRISHSCE